MAGSAPNTSVTGFQRSLTRKPKPKARIAGSEPTTSEIMTPLSSASTPIAAANVRPRKISSLARSRSSALARFAAFAVVMNRSPCRAISVTERLQAGSLGPILLQGRPGAATQSIQRPPRKTRDGPVETEQDTYTRVPCRVIWRLLRGDLQRLAGRVLDLFGPHGLDFSSHLLRHRDVIEIFRQLAALGVSPGEELQGLGGGGHVLRLLGDENKGRSGHRP